MFDQVPLCWYTVYDGSSLSLCSIFHPAPEYLNLSALTMVYGIVLLLESAHITLMIADEFSVKNIEKLNIVKFPTNWEAVVVEQV